MPTQRIKANLELFVQSILAPIVIADENLTIRFVNNATVATFGYLEEELIGKNVKILMTADTAAQHDTYVQNYKTGGVPRVIGTAGRKVIGKHKSGRKINLVLSINERTVEGLHYFIATFQDITESELIMATQLRNNEINFDSMACPVVVANHKLDIQFANRSALDTFEYRREELIGNNVKLLMLGETADKHDTYVRNYAEGGKPKIIGTQGRQVLGKTKSGKILNLILSVSETFRDDKSVFTATFQNISNTHKEIDAVRHRYEIILENVPAPVVLADNDLNIVYTNKSTSDVFGYSREELQGQNVTILMPESVAKRHDTYVANYITSRRPKIIGTYGRQVEGRHKEGRTINLVLTISEIQVEGETKYFTASFQDITELVAEQQQKYQLMESVSKTKSNFVANMSHEIRTPMNGIFGMLTILSGTQLDSVQREYIATCMRSAESLMSVLDDILTFSKAEADAVVLEMIPFALDEAIEDVMNIINGNIGARQNIDLVYYIDPQVPMQLIGDVSRLRQVLINLLGNAVKFTALGEIGLEVKVASTEPLTLRFEISDTGIGMSQEQVDRLFNPFSQADDSTTRRYGGTGLGLSICKLLVNLFKGQIQVTSRLGRGSTFSFTAQLAINPAANGTNLVLSEREKSLLREQQVLIIDDNAVNCICLEGFFKESCQKVSSCRSGVDGIDEIKRALLKNSPYTLLLLDYHMPNMDGIQVARSLQELKIPIRIVALSSIMDQQVLLREPNILSFLNKPIRKKLLLNMVLHLLVPDKINLEEPIIAGTGQIGTSGTDTVSTISAPSTLGTLGVTAGRRCLVVEDHVVNRKVICNLLREEHINSLEAENGLIAVEQYKAYEKEIDFILMDIHMPQMDGMEATKYIRAINKRVPIIALTADVSTQIEETCLKNGFNAYLTKPITASKLFRYIDNLTRPPNTSAPIMVVDNSATNHVIMSNLLKQLGYQCQVCYSGEECLESLKKCAEGLTPWPLLIFMDFKMPIMDGTATTAALKLRFLQKLTVIGLTTSDEKEEHRKGLAVGMSDVLAKPIQLNTLERILRKYLPTNIDPANSEMKITLEPPAKSNISEERPLLNSPPIVSKPETASQNGKMPEKETVKEEKETAKGASESVTEPTVTGGNDDESSRPAEGKKKHVTLSDFVAMEQLQASVSGDSALAIQLLGYYNTDLQAKLPLLAEACTERQHIKLMELSHSLKGAGGQLGLTKIFQICKDLEKISRETTPQWETAEKLLSSLRRNASFLAKRWEHIGQLC